MGEQITRVWHVSPHLIARCGLVGRTRVPEFGELSRAAREGWAGEKSGIFEHPEN